MRPAEAWVLCDGIVDLRQGLRTDTRSEIFIAHHQHRPKTLAKAMATAAVLELWWWSFLKDPPHIEGGTGVFFKGSFKTFLGTYAS